MKHLLIKVAAATLAVYATWAAIAASNPAPTVEWIPVGANDSIAWSYKSPMAIDSDSILFEFRVDYGKDVASYSDKNGVETVLARTEAIVTASCRTRVASMVSDKHIGALDVVVSNNTITEHSAPKIVDPGSMVGSVVDKICKNRGKSI